MAGRLRTESRKRSEMRVFREGGGCEWVAAARTRVNIKFALVSYAENSGAVLLQSQYANKSVRRKKY